MHCSLNWLHISQVISDIGAANLKPLFITICSVTAIMFVLSLVLERWYRHSGRLLPNMYRREKTFAILSILGATMGGVSLILLSVFDTARHKKVHRAFLVSTDKAGSHLDYMTDVRMCRQSLADIHGRGGLICDFYMSWGESEMVYLSTVSDWPSPLL